MKIREIVTYMVMGMLVLSMLYMYCASGDEKGKGGQSSYKPYQLPDDVVTMAQLEGHIMKIISRVEGDTVYIVEESYIPLESSIEYIVRTDTLALAELEQAQILLWQLEQQILSSEDSVKIDSLRNVISGIEMRLVTTEVEYDSHGFCFEPNVGGQLDSDLDAGISLGARVFYSGRFGGGFQGTLGFPLDSLYRSEHPVTLSVGAYGDYRLQGYENIAVKVFGEWDLTRWSGAGGIGFNFYWR